MSIMCSSNHTCDQDFVNNWIYSLADIRHETLQNKLIYLLGSKIHSGKCYVAGVLTQCSSGMCTYNTNFSKTTIGTSCVDNASSIATELYVKIHSINLQPMQYEEMKYTCMSDQCNSLSMFKHVSMETKILFNYTEPIMKWLQLRFRDQIRRLIHETFTRERTRMQDQSHRHATTTPGYWPLSKASSIRLLIVFICIMCTCCCSFWCKNR